MVWRLEEVTYYRLADSEPGVFLFQIPICHRRIAIDEKLTLHVPLFFKDHFIMGNNEKYQLILRGSTGLKRLPSDDTPETMASTDDFYLLAEYAAGAFQTISDEVSKSVAFSEWTSTERLFRSTCEYRGALDKLQIDVTNSFYRNIMKWAGEQLTRRNARNLAKLLIPMKKDMCL